LMKMNKEILASELKKRAVDQIHWQNFLQWKIKVWTWKDADGNTCTLCNGSGYKWRIGIFEVMEYTDDIKKLLIDGKTSFDIEKFALEKWMMNLERDGVFKVVKGMTTLDELYSIVTHK
jgi:type II secretory ATPase GspE/PulE/Tfp pilus assembly ATPase PilB-like protein